LDLEVLILDKKMRGRDGPTEHAKICNHKFVDKGNFYCILRNWDPISTICYKRTNVKFSDSISVLRGWFST